jgi:hypothetical protein
MAAVAAGPANVQDSTALWTSFLMSFQRGLNRDRSDDRVRVDSINMSFIGDSHGTLGMDPFA